MAPRIAEEVGATGDVAGKAYMPSLLLGEMDIPPPVFFCGVEPATAAVQKGK